MNPGLLAELNFLALARKKSYKYKVAGDNAYSSRPMGQGRYLKLRSAKNNKLQIAETRKGEVMYFEIPICGVSISAKIKENSK